MIINTSLLSVDNITLVVDEEGEEYVPPKTESVAHTEEGSFYNVRYIFDLNLYGECSFNIPFVWFFIPCITWDFI